MLDEPIPFKVLKCLEDGKELGEIEIVDAIKEDRESVRRALDKFVERGIVVEADGVYRRGSEFDFIFEKMLEAYEKVRTKPERGQVIRGLLNLLPRSYLISLDFVLRMARVEGFGEREVGDFLNDEAKRGLVRRAKMVSSEESPSFIYRTWRMRFLDRNEVERLKATWTSKGLRIYEKIFLLPRYPAGIADSSRRYLEGRKELMEKIEEIMQFLARYTLS